MKNKETLSLASCFKRSCSLLQPSLDSGLKKLTLCADRTKTFGGLGRKETSKVLMQSTETLRGAFTL